MCIRGEGGYIITPPHLGRETHRGEKIFESLNVSYLYQKFKHIFYFIISTFSKSRTMPEVKHRVSNVTSYGLQGAPITLQTDLTVLGQRCTQPGAKPTTESKDRKFRPLGNIYGRWHTPFFEKGHTPFFRTRVKGQILFPLPDFFPPCPASAHVRLETDPNSKKRKKSKSRTGHL